MDNNVFKIRYLAEMMS